MECMVNMAQWLILITTVLYFGAGFDFLFKAQYPMALVFISYALANIGLYLAAR